MTTDSVSRFSNGTPVTIGTQFNLTPPVPTDGTFTKLQGNGSGVLMADPGVYNGVPTQTTFTTSTTSTAAIPGNPFRSYLLIQNQDATNAIWVSFGGTAVADGTCLKIAAGGSVIFDGTFIPNTDVKIICSAGTPIVHLLEGN